MAASTILDKKGKLQILAEAFSPSAPITSKKSFYGRYNQLTKVENAVFERGQHIVMYGERGVGKTSLANIAEEMHKDIYTVKITCSRKNTFASLWQEVLKTLSFVIKFDETSPDQKLEKHLNGLLKDSFDIQAIQFVFGQLKNSLLIILDEFDVIKGEESLSLFADAIKSFSDNLPRVTLMIVGIAENISELLGEHTSLERCICQIPVPRMSQEELKDLIDSGMMKLKMKMDERVKEDIISFSQGFPHYVHLLSKHSVLNAIDKKYTAVVRNNFDEAINEVIDNVYESTRQVYQKAVHTNKESALYEHVVQACALVKEDEHGTFKASDLLLPLKEIATANIPLKAYTYHLSMLPKDSRGNILQKVVFGKQTRYRFKNPIVKAYILLRLYQKGFLKKRQKLTSFRTI